MPSETTPEDGKESYMCTLPDDVKKYASEVLHEEEERREEDIRKIQQWLEEEKHLGARNDDLSVLKFLRGCKFNIELTQRKLKSFYEMRAKVPEWYSNRDPSLPELQEMLKMGTFLPLLEKADGGEQVVIIRAAVHDPRKHKQDDLFKMSNMIVDMIMDEDELISVYGVTAVVDLKGVSLGHALQMTPSIIRKAVHSWQDCYPVRVKSMNFINGPPYVDVVLNIFRRFMNQKMASRVFVHGKSVASFHKVVPPSILPEEYGGKQRKLQDLIAHWNNKVMEKRDWFLEDEKYKAEIRNSSKSKN